MRLTGRERDRERDRERERGRDRDKECNRERSVIGKVAREMGAFKAETRERDRKAYGDTLPGEERISSGVGRVVAIDTKAAYCPYAPSPSMAVPWS